MFGLLDRTRLAMHERTLLQAIGDAPHEEVRGSYAVAAVEALTWLAKEVGAVPGACAREIVDEVQPYSLKRADSMFMDAANTAHKQGDIVCYQVQTVLAGIMLTRVVEVARPNLALRAVRHRGIALDFLEPLFVRGLEITEQYRQANAAASAGAERPEPCLPPKDQRTNVIAAFATEGVGFETDPDNTQFCISAVTAVVREVMRRAGSDTRSPSFDEVWAGGILALILASHLATIVGVRFEFVSSCAVLRLFDRPLGEDVGAFYVSVADDYNDCIKSGQVVEDIGTKFATWIHSPTREGFIGIATAYVRLCDAHATCRPAYA